MENQIELNLDAIRQALLEMASRAEGAVNRAVQALLERNGELAGRVKAEDDVIDEFEVRIDELAILHLTKAPLATDLRLVTTAMKISQNLERIGDEATKIARRAIALAQEPVVNLDLDVAGMARMTLAMMKDALDAFVDRDAGRARQIPPRDREVDALNREIQQTLVRHMTEYPDQVPCCLSWLEAAKSLERIADHAKNIAEEVVYLYEAEDIRHPARI